MSNEVKCINCKASIDLNNEKVSCFTCELGHLLCKKCNDVAEQSCPECGGKIVRKVADKTVKELYKTTPKDWIKKLENSCDTLNFDQQVEFDEQSESPEPPTVIGFRKWPRSFFHKIPNENDSLSHDERALLEILPHMIETETTRSIEAISEGPFWESLPKSYNDLEMPCEIMKCPITRCQYPICNFDATGHLLLSHDCLPIEMVERFEVAQTSVNPMSMRKNEIKALLRILFAGVVTDLGLTKHNNCLPLYLLCTRLNILETEHYLMEFQRSMDTGIAVPSQQYCNEIFTDNDYAARNPWQINDCLLIWCAGTIPLNHPFNVAISAFPDDDSIITLGTTVNIFSINKPQTGDAIYKTMDRLIITKNEIERLSKGKKNFEVRISFL